MVASPWRASLLIGLLLVTGCAMQPEVMRFDITAGMDADRLPVWPKAPEVPRFLFVGQLTGEDNFSPAEETKQSLGYRVFSAIVGLTFRSKSPVVLQRPQGGVVDEQGRIYVTDVSRRAVYVFDVLEGDFLVWEFALPDTRFIAPIGIAIGANGEFLVSDAELGVIVRLGPDGSPLGIFSEGIVQRPTGIVRDAEGGRVYVADTQSDDIKVFDDEGNLVDRFGGDGETEEVLNSPTYLAWHEGRIYVTDTLNARVQVFNEEGDLVNSIGERGLYVGNFSLPKGIGVDDQGNIFVVESYYDHLLIFDPEGKFLLPIGGTGHNPGQFYLPAGVWTDSRGLIYVADMFNGRICVFQFLGGLE